MTDFTGKKIILTTWIAPDENGAQTLRDFTSFTKSTCERIASKRGP